MKIIINILRFNLEANKLENVAAERYEDEAGAHFSLMLLIKNNDKPLMAKAISLCADYRT